MRKILFGTIVFFSLAFLAACGGGGSGSSGSAGTAGTAGADGAAGATGSIALFEDADLITSFNGAMGSIAGATPTAVALDNGTVIGQLSGTLHVRGTDNLTAGSRNRYYVYTESSAGVQRKLSDSTCSTSAEAGLNSRYDAGCDGILDTRLKSSSPNSTDNLTVTLQNWPLLEGVAGVTYATTYISVCPGNEAGDGSCAKVLAPAYDRGIGTASPQTGQTLALAASVTYVGSHFHVLADNVTGSNINDNQTLANTARTFAYRIPDNKSGYDTAQVSNSTSAGTILDPITDNHTNVSNILVVGSNLFFAMSSDNNSSASDINHDEGDNLSVAYRADGSDNFTDNGTIISNHVALTSAPQIADGGNSFYIMMGNTATIANHLYYPDNGTTNTLGAAGREDNGTSHVGTGNWCSSATGVDGGDDKDTATSYATIISDNGTSQSDDTENTPGIKVSIVYDNGTTNLVSAGATSGHIDLDLCAVTHLSDTFYVALTDNGTSTAGDNVTVWKSSDLGTWTQIGDDFTLTGTAASIAIGTTGTSASDNGVWVGVNDAGEVKVLHYEDISGGSDYAWRSVGTVLDGATTSGAAAGISLATNGSNTIAVTAVKSGVPNVGFWFQQ